MTSYKFQKQHASNYNYKGKRSFGQRIKNFFTIPEEDLKEEPSKEFEKIKLFTLTRGILFLGILVFMILINILVGFNINFLYLRQILGFLFLILIPGLLIMLCFKIRTVKFWEYLVYTVGLSIAFIMFAGLAVNWTLPALGITDKPLSLWPILICFDIFLLGLWLTAIYRNKDLKPFDITIPKLDTLNRIFFIIPMVFPLLSILGAFLLNNHGPNILTMIMLGGIAVYVLLLVLFRKHMNENIWPWAILMMSLALLFMFSLRGWYVNGWDLKQEQYVFRLTYENSFWSMGKYRDAYNSCLSINILPTITKLFLNINLQMPFKLFAQIIFLFHSIAIFLLFRKYLSSNLSFLSSFLYFATGGYSRFSGGTRQEIAFLFFGLMLLVLFAKDINPVLRKTLFVIFGASMIVSHYSTSYISLALFTLGYIFTVFYKMYENRNIKKRSIDLSQKSEFYLTGILVLLLLIFGFLWMSQLTETSNGVIYVAKITIKNIGESFTWDLKDSSVQGALFGRSSREGYTNSDLNGHINETKNLISIEDSYSDTQIQDYNPHIIPRGEIIYPKTRLIAYLSFYLYSLVKYLIILSFIIGSLLIYLTKNKVVDKEFSFMIIISVIFMGLIILLPYVSKMYGFNRMFQQCLLLLSFSSLIFFKSVFKSFRKIGIFFILFAYLVYSLVNLGFLLPFSGGEPTLNLYNQGFNYNALYSHTGEKASINWFEYNKKDYFTYMDPHSELDFYAFGNPSLSHDKKIIPILMTKSAYAYSNYANIIKGINYWDAREKFNNGVLSFNFPIEFLDKNKNKIYNNGDSTIFK